MTPKERAKEATSEAGCPDWGSDDQEQLELAVEQAITAAVAEEREACRKVAAGWARLYDPFSDPRCTVAINIAEAIAARCNTYATTTEERNG